MRNIIKRIFNDAENKCPLGKHNEKNNLKYINVRLTVNKLLFAIALFRDLLEINWFVANNFRDQALFIFCFF